MSTVLPQSGVNLCPVVPRSIASSSPKLAPPLPAPAIPPRASSLLNPADEDVEFTVG